MNAAPAPVCLALASASQAVAAWCRRGIHAWYVFSRFPVMGASALMLLIGAATVSAHPTAAQILSLLGVAVLFHHFAYVFNDVIDLPVDRTEPLRAESPLVQGKVGRGQALACALLMVPLAFGITAWQSGHPRIRCRPNSAPQGLCGTAHRERPRCLCRRLPWRPVCRGRPRQRHRGRAASARAPAAGLASTDSSA